MKGVYLTALKDFDRYEESGANLHDSVPYNQNNSLNNELKFLSDQLFRSLKLQEGYKQEQKQNDFETLLANLFDQIKKPISISLFEKDWKKTKYNNSSYSNIIEFLSILNKLKYIEMRKGYN
ncbi:MAG: hypothetical protein WC988_04630 [Patescibacteria group bacterium]